MAQELKPFKLGSVELGEYWAYDADEVDAVLAKKDAEIRRLQRALWLARAQRAADKQTYYNECRYDGWIHRVNVWLEVERKCRAKAKQYTHWDKPEDVEEWIKEEEGK